MRLPTPALLLALTLVAPARTQEKVDPAVEGFRQRLAQAGDRETLRKEVAAFVRQKVGTPAATQAAGVLSKLPSPLDHLDPRSIPELDRFGWQPKELVAVLGEHRGRHGNYVSAVAWTPD